jgi:hypothetical protein
MNNRRKQTKSFRSIAQCKLFEINIFQVESGPGNWIESNNFGGTLMFANHPD